MGTKTKGYLSQSITVQDIQRALKSELGIYSDLEKIDVSSFAVFYVLDFSHKGEQRRMSVFEKYNDEDIKATVISLSMYGDSKKIIKTLVSHFGGAYEEDDTEAIKVYL